MNNRTLRLSIIASILVLMIEANQARAVDAALIIGIGGYPNLLAPERISWSTNDALAFENTLKRACGGSLRYRVVIGAQATTINIRKACDQLEEDVGPENVDRLFLYYSGHLYPASVNEVHLVPYDIDREERNYGDPIDRFIANLCKKLNPNHMVVFIDACNAGAAAKDSMGNLIYTLPTHGGGGCG